MDLTSQIHSISEEQLDSLFNGGEVKVNQLPTVSDVKVETKDEGFNMKVGKDPISLPTIDLDETPTPDDKKDETKVDDKKDEDTKVEEKTEDKVKEGQEGKDEEKTEDIDVTQVNQILKTTVDYLVEKGLLRDFENRDKTEITESVYADLVSKEVESRVDDMFGELLDTTGDYGKAIISHIRNGGNPDDIIDIFKEQKQLENYDVSSDNGKIGLIQKYYRDVIGWNQSKIDKYVNTLKGQDTGLDEEVAEVQSKYDELYTKQLQQIQADQRKQAEDAKRKQQKYVQDLTSAIDGYETLKPEEKKMIKSSVLNHNKKLPDGTPVSEFYLKFYEIQQDPKEYVKLVHWIMDRDGYDKKVTVANQGKDTQKDWKFIKGNSAVNKRAADDFQKPDNKKGGSLDFSGIFKK